MNRYPLWKNLMIVLALVVSILYALPNFFGQQPAVQISSTGDKPVTQALLEPLKKALDEAGLAVSDIRLTDGKLLLRMDDPALQLKVADYVRDWLRNQEMADRYVVALNLLPKTPTWLQDIGGKPMVLGLDLQGGVHFLLQVDMDTAIKQQYERLRDDIRTTLRENKIRYTAVKENGKAVTILLRNDEELDKALNLLRTQYPELDLNPYSENGKSGFRGVLTQAKLVEIKATALQQNITTLRNRVNELGVAEPLVQQQGDDRIVVELPGVQDPAYAKQVLSATATLEYRAVDDKHDAYTAHTTGRVPPGSRLYYDKAGRPVLLKKRLIVSGEQLVDAQYGLDTQTGQPQVSVTLNSVGAQRMRQFTLDNVGKGMAVVFIERKPETVMVDGKPVKKTKVVEKVISVANILEPFGKRFRTTGLDSPREAQQLALLLRAGALAAPVEIVEERTVGPSLGQENIEKGMEAVVIGFVLVLIFMALRYKLFGLVADVALFFNLVMLMALLSMLGATLTLPGIAGIVLTVGMAVDANVLIFERIREELRLGNSPHASINAGYDKAFSTIADANVTTLLAAVILFSLGTGPVKGFAVTLSLGILTSMFTAIMATRMLINWIHGGKQRLSGLSV